MLSVGSLLNLLFVFRVFLVDLDTLLGKVDFEIRSFENFVLILWFVLDRFVLVIVELLEQSLLPLFFVCFILLSPCILAHNLVLKAYL